MREQVQAVLDEIRPSMNADGGDIQLVDVKEGGIVEVKLTGACQGCPMAVMTLKMGVERLLKERLPEVTEVVTV
jgi:Fe-S cluster biogenesis protein NfuA